LHDDMYSRFDRTPTYGRQTNRQTHEHTVIAHTRSSVVLRGKNVQERYDT